MWTDERRRNKLSYNRSTCIEYAVHGLYRCSRDDSNGRHGCWWLSVKKLVRSLGRPAVTAKLEEFELQLAEARADAVAAVESDSEGE